MNTIDATQDDQGERQRPQARRGFAGLDPERRREIARQGGRAAHAMGRAHEFTPEEARSARARRGQPVDTAPAEPAAGAV